LKEEIKSKNIFIDSVEDMEKENEMFKEKKIKSKKL